MKEELGLFEGTNNNENIIMIKFALWMAEFKRRSNFKSEIGSY
jgi:hypothetical protein